MTPRTGSLSQQFPANLHEARFHEVTAEVLAKRFQRLCAASHGNVGPPCEQVVHGLRALVAIERIAFGVNVTDELVDRGAPRRPRLDPSQRARCRRRIELGTGAQGASESQKCLLLVRVGVR